MVGFLWKTLKTRNFIHFGLSKLHQYVTSYDNQLFIKLSYKIRMRIRIRIRIDSSLKILNEKMTESMNHFMLKVFVEQLRLHRVC